MHLLADGEAKPDPVLKAMISVKKKPRWDKLKALLLKVAARVFNFRRLWDTWRVDLDRLAEGKVKLVFSVLYMPDAEMNIEDWPNGSPDDDYYGELIALIQTVNKSLEGDGTPAQRKAVVVKAPADLEPAPGDNLPRFAHCIEGGFHLGGTASQIDARVSELASAGVAYITLAHLFWRQVATNAPALPFLTDGQYRYLFPQPREVGLNELGRVAVAAMHRHRVLVDISHMSEAAIQDTFTLLEELDDRHGTEPKEFPVVATHAGYRFGEQSYMLSAETIEAIAARGGVIGLIMAHHQLNDGLFRHPGDLTRTLASMHAHIDAIREITGSHEHVGIGSDLDGFIKPTVGGIEYANDLGKLIEPLEATYGAEAAAGILYGNALGALEKTLTDPAYPAPGVS
jgi:microsomal dipeptidase-like Zn-dependent dipeptidase